MSSVKKMLRRAYRKLFRGEKKPPAPGIDRFLGKPKELFGVGNAQKVSIVYIGNGASGNSYQEEIGKRNLEGKARSGMGGFYNECAVLYAPLHADGRIDIPVIEAFRHPSEQAVFAGFTLRKREDEVWKWYGDDGSWDQYCSHNSKKLFFMNDTLPEDPSEADAPVYVLTAQWTDGSGRSMNCGYRMFRNRMMAHALGTIDNNKYLNTLSALEHNIRNGYHYFETDVRLTEDDRLLMCHGWTEEDCSRFGIPYDPAFENMTYDMARQLRICGEPIPDAREFYDYIKDLPEEYCFEIDLHSVPQDRQITLIRQLVEDFRNDEAVLDRLLIQVYHSKMFRAIDSVRRFEVYQYSMARDITQLDRVINFCLNNGICALAIRASEASEETVKKVKAAGLNILAFTINSDLTYARTLLERGVDTICTNFITEEAIREHREIMKEQPYYLRIPRSMVKDLSDPNLSYEEAEGAPKYIYMKVTNLRPNSCLPDLKEPAPRPGKRFMGWAIRRPFDGANPWYCVDNTFRTAPKVVPGTDQDRKFFETGDELPVLQVKTNERLQLIARWEAVQEEKQKE